MGQRMKVPAEVDARGPEPPGEAEPHHPELGSLLLALGAVLVGLSIIDQSVGLPFWMPRSWFSNRPLWYFLAIACLVGGAMLLRNRRPVRDERPPRTGRRFESVVLYTREDCHLCHQAKDTLLRYAAYLPATNEVDVGKDPELLEAYGRCVPVVEIDGKVRFRGQVNEVLLRRLIEAAQTNP